MDLGEERVRVLPVTERVILVAAVSEREIEEAVGPERDVPAVVIAGGIVVGSDDVLLRAERGSVLRRAGEAAHGGAKRPRDVVREIDVPVLREVRMEGHPEEARLALV